MASDYTKVTRRKLWLFRILDALCLFMPLVIYFFIALSSGEVGTVAKFTCSGLCVVALILSIFNVIAAKRLTCIKWLICLGLYIAIKEYLLPLFCMMAVVTVLDDFCFQAIIQHYKMKLEASKVMDERTEE